MARVVKDDQGTASAIQLKARGAKRFVTVQTRIKPSAPADYYLVSLDVRMRDFSGQGRFWPQAGVIIQSRDRLGQWLWYWPSQVLGINGDVGEWRTLRGLAPIANAAHRTVAFTYVLADTGTAEFRKLKVQLARERPAFTVAYFILITAWAGFALAVARLALLRRGRNWGRLVAVVVAGVMIFGGTVPQPGLKESMRSISYSTQDLIYAVRYGVQEWFAADESPERPETGQALAEQRQQTAADDAINSDKTASEQSHQDESARKPGVAKPETDARPRSTARSRPQIRYWDPQINYLDKLFHVVAFAFFACLVQLSWRETGPLRTAFLVLCVSAGIQFMQLLMITRDGDLYDFSADLTGVALGTAIGAFLTRRAWRQ